MGKKSPIIEVDHVSEVVNKSFGFWKPAQVIAHKRDVKGDYAALAAYLMHSMNVADDAGRDVTLNRLQIAAKDLTLSEEEREAAEQVWEDLSYIRMMTNNAAMVLHGGRARNAALNWHYHGTSVERTILCKYAGEPTEIAKHENVTSWGEESVDRDFVMCEVDNQAELIRFSNGDMFAIAGGARIFGKPVVHRKPEPDGNPSLTLIAEPEV